MSEKLVQHALNNVRKDRTTIIVAHRLSTIRDADRIYVFDKGTIAETGTHTELIDARGIYYDLLMTESHETQLSSDSTTMAADKEMISTTRPIDSSLEQEKGRWLATYMIMSK